MKSEKKRNAKSFVPLLRELIVVIAYVTKKKHAIVRFKEAFFWPTVLLQSMPCNHQQHNTGFEMSLRRFPYSAKNGTFGRPRTRSKRYTDLTVRTVEFLQNYATARW